MKLNNKGFAITGFLYSIFAIFLVILSMLIISMTSSKLTLDKVKKNIKTSLDDVESSEGLYEKAFSYTGSEQSFTAPYTGWYLIELWGARGATSALPGKGAYTSGKIYLTKNEILYFYIGSEGKFVNSSSLLAFNGGGGGSATCGTNNLQGGGATDVRITNGAWNNSASLASRIMVAAGGGAGGYGGTGGNGGTLTGRPGGYLDNSASNGLGGNQIVGGNLNGTFGIGGTSYQDTTCDCSEGGGGGGGYYGGGGARLTGYRFGAGGAGGSSFISGYAGVNAVTSQSSLTPTNNIFHYSNKYFINGVMQSGINNGDGKARITYLSETKPIVKNDKLNNVRYIKDCINGNSVTSNNSWLEIEATQNGNNVALGKAVSITGTVQTGKSLSIIVDGNITTDETNILRINENSSLQCATVDLGQTYNLDEIVIWHYWGTETNYTYNSNTTYVSSDDYSWTIVKNTKELETSNGKRISAYEYSDVDANTNNIIYKNLATNGSFENGATDWAFSTNVTNSTLFAKYGTNSVRNYHGVAWSAAYRTSVSYPIVAFSNHIYYTSGWSYTVNKGNGSCLNYYNIIYDNAEHWINYQIQNNLNVWEKGSAIFTVPNVYNPKLGFALADTDSSNALQECYTDGVLLVDLTATFGAGNEPTKEWCDANLNYVDATGYTKIYQK